MTAEMAPRPERQVRAQGGNQKMVRHGIVLAAGLHILLHDRRFHAAAITGAIGAVALADLLRHNEARPVRRAASWYWEARREPEAGPRPSRDRRELPQARRAIEAGKRS
jgi:hypothetical protein